MEARKDILWRVYLVYVSVLIFALLVIGRVFYIQVFEGEELKKKADELTIDTLKVDAIRGDICADDGSLLATSIPIFEIRVDFVCIERDFFYDNIDSLSMCLSNLFKDKSKKEYKQIFIRAKKKNERYFLLKRGVDYKELKELRKFPIFRVGRYSGGKIEIQRYRREMPYKTLASRIIGFKREKIYVGLEGSYCKKLEGKSGLALKQKISGGEWMPINDDNEVEPQNGSDIITTINVNMQDVTETALMKSLMQNNAHHGCAIVMDVKTGEIKAMANLTRTKEGKYEEKYNYAIGESSEPGSTFKLISLVAAIEDGLVDIDDTVNTGNGECKYFNQNMRDCHKGGYGRISVLKSFAVSSNVGISKVIYRCYSHNPQKFIDRLYSMRVNQSLKLDIGGEGMPIIKNTKSKSWSKVSLPWMAVGYELALTPLQTLNFYNTIANNGKMMKPMFVKEIKKMGKVIEHHYPIVLQKSICSKSTIDKAHILLKEVVENGTAKNIKNKLFQIAGKTGTAQIASGSSGYKNENGIKYKASFVGYFPADDPKFSCIVVINDPSCGIYYGGSVSAPVFKEIADKSYATHIYQQTEKNTIATNIIPLISAGNTCDINIILKTLNIHTLPLNQKYQWASGKREQTKINYVEKKIVQGLMPDVIGMTAKDAIYILENMGMKVKIYGRGNVINQSKKSETIVNKGEEIVLDLSCKLTIDSSYIFTMPDTLNDKKLLEDDKNKINDKSKNSQQKETVIKFKDGNKDTVQNILKDNKKLSNKNKTKDKPKKIQKSKEAVKPKDNNKSNKEKTKIKSNKKQNNQR